MNNKEAIKLIQKQIDQIENLKIIERFLPNFGQWKKETQTTIKHIFGDNSDNLNDFNGVDYGLFVFTDLTPESEFQKAYVEGLENAKAILNAMVNEIKSFGVKEKEGGSKWVYYTNPFWLLKQILIFVQDHKIVSSFFIILSFLAVDYSLTWRNLKIIFDFVKSKF